MSLEVCLVANTSRYPEGGGHRWVYLNWALGLQEAGCDVVWLEEIFGHDDVAGNVAALRRDLEPFGLADSIGLFLPAGEPLPATADGCLGLDDVDAADLFLNLAYDIRPEVVARFRHTALVDIDPGLSQLWMSQGNLPVAAHDVYLTTGETVGRPGSRIPDVGLRWEHVPPCVSVRSWAHVPPPANGAAFTTLGHWYGGEEELEGEEFPNDKRSGFLPFLELPSRTWYPLELALDLDEEDDDQELLTRHGWRLREGASVAATAADYQRYIRGSLGEFSCVKPSCLVFQNAWVSDRTLCYLASGRPAVVQHTGPSSFLPDAEGLFRFRDLDEAADCLETVMSNYDEQSRLARALANEYFDAKEVVSRVLELAVA